MAVYSQQTSGLGQVEAHITGARCVRSKKLQHAVRQSSGDLFFAKLLVTSNTRGGAIKKILWLNYCT